MYIFKGASGLSFPPSSIPLPNYFNSMTPQMQTSCCGICTYMDEYAYYQRRRDGLNCRKFQFSDKHCKSQRDELNYYGCLKF